MSLKFYSNKMYAETMDMKNFTNFNDMLHKYKLWKSKPIILIIYCPLLTNISNINLCISFPFILNDFL